jgi:filamentous hemagglutinin family protein
MQASRAFVVCCCLLASFILLPLDEAVAQPAPDAGPQGGTVVAGTASIADSSGTTTVTQSSARAAIDWTSFDVGSQHVVSFRQPSASAVTLVRVAGPDPSEVAGRILSNGSVIITNRSGIRFLKGAMANDATLIASAASLTNQNFMAGQMVFDQQAEADAAVSNAGNITVKQAGWAELLAPVVSNAGAIQARLGHIVLASARTATLDLFGDGLTELDVTENVTSVPIVNGRAVSSLVTQAGSLSAPGGTVLLAAKAPSGLLARLVSDSGLITAGTASTRRGAVRIESLGGSITVGGKVTTAGVKSGQTGGTMELLSNAAVTLGSRAVLDASGPSGGGVIAVGTTEARAAGGPSIQATTESRRLNIPAGARVAADATARGNGGRIAMLASRRATLAGGASSRGGPGGGNGGTIELSSAVVIFTGTVDVSAPAGAPGTFLLHVAS